MSGNSDEHGQEDHGKVCDGVDGEGPGAEMESFTCSLGKAGGERFLGVMMEEPQRDKTKGEIEGEDTGKGVAEAAVMSKGDEVFEIRREAAYDDSGHDEPRAPEG